MAKISELPTAGPLTGAETMPIVQDGDMKRVPFDTVLAQQLATLVDEGAIQTSAVTVAGTTLVNQAASAALQGQMRIDDKTTYIGVAPSATWNGTAGTGFASTPTDPTRTTAKPALRLIEPPNQAFTDYKVVGVAAFANNLGYLDNCGLKDVTFHYEGGTAVVNQPSFRSFPDVNGKMVTYFGWWVTLLHNGTNGYANLYAKATPKHIAMQSRVIGPYLFLPSATLYDLELTVAPSLAQVTGSRYQSVTNALTYCAAQGKHHPHITITEARTDYVLAQIGSPFAYNAGKGYATIEANVPVTIIGTAVYADATPRTRYDGLRFKGANITLDFKTMHSIWKDDGVGIPHWFDGCTLTNSGGRGYAVPQLKGPRTAGPTRGTAYFTECTFNNMPNTLVGAALGRGCSASNSFSDFGSEAFCLIGNRVDDYNAYVEWAKDTNAFTCTYTGAGTTATLELSGLNNATTRTFTAKVDGASVGTFAVSTPSATAVSAVVAWLNGLSGWSATTQNDERRASLCGLPGTIAGAFGPQNCKSVTLQIITFYDVHGDFYQQNSPANVTENVIVTDNIVSNFAGQGFFISSTSVANDFVFVNNSFHEAPGTGWTFLSQLARAGAKSHLVFGHNSYTQTLRLATSGGWNADAYCLIANNAIAGVYWDVTPDTDIRIDGNHVYATSGTPSGATNHTIGGDASTLWQSIAAGDVTPKSALLTNLKLPVLGRDYLGRRRSKADAAGAAV